MQLLYFCTADYFPVRSYDSEHTHGTGCTLSSVIASALALGHQRREVVESTGEHMEGASSAIYPVDACCLAKAYVTAGIAFGQAVSSSTQVI
jgi:hydroxymethylpyrimidine/phosphomethylpyrimidine kinase